MKSELEGSDNETVMKAISSVREAVEGNSQIARLRAIAARLVKSCQAAGATSKSGGKGRQTRG